MQTLMWTFIFAVQILQYWSIKQAIVSQDKDGKYYVSILVEVNKSFPNKPDRNRNDAIGIDFGVKTFLTLSNGDKIENPKYLKQSQDKLAKHQSDLELLDKDTTKCKSKREQITKLYSKKTIIQCAYNGFRKPISDI